MQTSVNDRNSRTRKIIPFDRNRLFRSFDCQIHEQRLQNPICAFLNAKCLLRLSPTVAFLCLGVKRRCRLSSGMERTQATTRTVIKTKVSASLTVKKQKCLGLIIRVKGLTRIRRFSATVAIGHTAAASASMANLSLHTRFAGLKSLSRKCASAKLRINRNEWY